MRPVGLRIDTALSRMPAECRALRACMQMAQHCSARLRIRFEGYDQSSKCYSQRDSSVSYAAAVATVAAT